MAEWLAPGVLVGAVDPQETLGCCPDCRAGDYWYAQRCWHVCHGDITGEIYQRAENENQDSAT